MLTRIDHVVVVVGNLDAATAGYRNAGFAVTPGGVHAGGETHNALVPFQDGTFIELIAFLRDEPDRRHYFSERHRLGGGLAEFALSSTDIDRDILDIAARGIDYPQPTSLSRIRPDGVQLDWTMSLPGLVHRGLGFPFLIQDLTDRALRVPSGAAETTHANGAVGVAGVTVVVNDLDAAVSDYGAILGVPQARLADIDLAGKGLTRMSLPGNPSQWIALMQTVPDSIPSAWYDRFGEGPYAVHLRRDANSEIIPGDGALLDPGLVGGARLYL